MRLHFRSSRPPTQMLRPLLVIAACICYNCWQTKLTGTHLALLYQHCVQTCIIHLSEMISFGPLQVHLTALMYYRSYTVQHNLTQLKVYSNASPQSLMVLE